MASLLTAARATVGIELPEILDPIISVPLVGVFVGLNFTVVWYHDDGDNRILALFFTLAVSQPGVRWLLSRPGRAR